MRFVAGDRVLYTGVYDTFGGEGSLGTVEEDFDGDEGESVSVKWDRAPYDCPPARTVFAGNIATIKATVVPLTAEEDAELRAGYEAVSDEPWDFTKTFPAKVDLLYAQARDVLLSKHHDYGPKNISQSPGGPLNGLRVRMWDKTARLNNLLDSGNEAQHESLEDTLLDLANYALIGVLVLRGDWPES